MCQHAWSSATWIWCSLTHRHKLHVAVASSSWIKKLYQKQKKNPNPCKPIIYKRPPPFCPKKVRNLPSNLEGFLIWIPHHSSKDPIPSANCTQCAASAPVAKAQVTLAPKRTQVPLLTLDELRYRWEQGPGMAGQYSSMVGLAASLTLRPVDPRWKTQRLARH